jgi:hypothetical protein
MPDDEVRGQRHRWRSLRRAFEERAMETMPTKIGPPSERIVVVLATGNGIVFLDAREVDIVGALGQEVIGGSTAVREALSIRGRTRR